MLRKILLGMFVALLVGSVQLSASIKTSESNGKLSPKEKAAAMVMSFKEERLDDYTVVKNAKIALLDCTLEIKKPETDAAIRITSPEQLQAFLDQEEKMLKNYVDKIVETGANVVFCQKGIDDIAQHFLAKQGILAVRRVKKSDMEKIAKATGARIVSNIKDLSDKDLGYAEKVEEKKVGGEALIFIEGCKDPKAVTILLRGGSSHVVDEAERAIDDALGAVCSALVK